MLLLLALGEPGVLLILLLVVMTGSSTLVMLLVLAILLVVAALGVSGSRAAALAGAPPVAILVLSILAAAALVAIPTLRAAASRASRWMDSISGETGSSIGSLLCLLSLSLLLVLQGGLGQDLVTFARTCQADTSTWSNTRDSGFSKLSAGYFATAGLSKSILETHVR
jgi:hypothetical protein